MYFDPPPYPLSIGQVAHTYCYNAGLVAASIVRPIHSEGTYVHESDKSNCPDPYELPPDTPKPASLDGAHYRMATRLRFQPSKADSIRENPANRRV